MPCSQTTGLGEDAVRTGLVTRRGDQGRGKATDGWERSTTYPRAVGREQRIEIGHMSGKSNVVWWLESRGYAAAPYLVDRIFDHAKRTDHVLTDEEISALIGADPVPTP